MLAGLEHAVCMLVSDFDGLGGERPDSSAPWQQQHLVKAANRCTGASADKAQLTLVGCADHARQLGFRNYEFRRLLEFLRCRGPDTWIG
jgi:hypothetical protein